MGGCVSTQTYSVEPNHLPQEQESKNVQPVFQLDDVAIFDMDIDPTTEPDLPETTAIKNTALLARMYRQLTPKNPYHPLLHDLSLQVLEQFGHRLVKTSSLVKEVTMLARTSNPEILTKLLQQFLNTIHHSQALDIDMVDGLADALQFLDPNIWKMGSTSDLYETKGEIKKQATNEHFSAVDELVNLLVVIMQKFDAMHKQAINRGRVIQLLKSVNRILIAMYETGVTKISKENLHDPLCTLF